MSSKGEGPLEGSQGMVWKLYHGGNTDADMALELGVSRSAIYLWRKRHGLSRNSRMGRTYRTWHYRVLLLLEEGKSATEIASLLGKKLDTVQRVIARKYYGQQHPTIDSSTYETEDQDTGRPDAGGVFERGTGGEGEEDQEVQEDAT